MNLLDLARKAMRETRSLAEFEPPIDPDVERRRAMALAMLTAEPSRRIAVVAEVGDPVHVAVAIRGVAVGEMEIKADCYNGFELFALMQELVVASRKTSVGDWCRQ